MAIPDFQSTFLPILRYLADGEERRSAEIRERIAADLELTPEEIAERLPSGVQSIFANRVAWGTVYLMKSGAIERTRRGVFRITERGRQVLSTAPARLTVQDLSQFPEFVVFHKGQPAGDGVGKTPDPDLNQTPDEQLARAYQELRSSLANEVLDTIKKVAPKAFEELVIDLLVAMGYGGSMEEAGKAIGKPGDGGIDGIIKEDKLGLDAVYVQAKRWADSVGRPVVQAFAGSLEGFRARKGVLITTSSFTADALEYVQRIEKRIVLIGGEQLAQLMIDHNVGVTVVQTYQVKRLDSDYFEAV